MRCVWASIVAFGALAPPLEAQDCAILGTCATAPQWDPDAPGFHLGASGGLAVPGGLAFGLLDPGPAIEVFLGDAYDRDRELRLGFEVSFHGSAVTTAQAVIMHLYREWRFLRHLGTVVLGVAPRIGFVRTSRGDQDSRLDGLGLGGSVGLGITPRGAISIDAFARLMLHAFNSTEARDPGQTARVGQIGLALTLWP